VAVPQGRERVLVVDDNPGTLEILQRNLVGQGYRVFTAPAVADAIRLLDSTPVELVITDLKMPEVDGLDLVRHVRENLADTEVMMITGYPSIESAVEAVKIGAQEYLAKPFTDAELLSAVGRALSKQSEHRARRESDGGAAPVMHGLIGESDAMQRVHRIINKAAASSATVLITGESGTGKELFARAIHYNSPRASGPFVPVNCGGIPEGLLESELFGHVKGAFTGATESRVGFFQTADGGTIFLDEISETSPPMQVKLLRTLQDMEVGMVGSRRTRKVDVRVVAATNKDLATLVDKGVFREDLFFRLNVIAVGIPPLRDRGEDILLLTNHFVQKFSAEMGEPPPQFSDRAVEMLRHHDWPGNVRELQNVIQRVVVMAEDDVIDAPDLPSLMRFSASRRGGLDRTLSEVEITHICDVLSSVGGNKTRAADILGIDRKTLREKLKRHNGRGS
jgi:DNA-binding NtrC family response regulator